MIRQIIEIDEDRCVGCGLCAGACHEGAIAMIDGKARLIRDDYCDGLGNCLPVCPTNAIRFIQREAAAYDEAAVEAHMRAKKAKEAEEANEPRLARGCPGSKAESLLASVSSPAGGKPVTPISAGCPGSRAESLTPLSRPVLGRTPVSPLTQSCPGSAAKSPQGEQEESAPMSFSPINRLAQWPVQIQLAPVNAAYFQDADVLIAADCSAYAYAGFHETFMRGRITLIGCPKLDPVDYSEKLTAIFQKNDIQAVTLTRMEVPCCGGMELAVRRALMNSGRDIPFSVVTISTRGKILAGMDGAVPPAAAPAPSAPRKPIGRPLRTLKV